MAIETVNLEVFAAYDILALFPEGFEESFWDGDFLDATYGDAVYTIIAGDAFVQALHACWEVGDWATEAMWNDLLEGDLSEVNNPNSLVALEG